MSIAGRKLGGHPHRRSTRGDDSLFEAQRAYARVHFVRLVGRERRISILAVGH